MPASEVAWEQRIWTVAQMLMVASILWVGSSMLRISDSVARIEVKLEASAERLQILESAAAAGMNDRYRGQDARKDWDAQRQINETHASRLNAIVATIQDLRQRLDTLERRQR